MTVTDRLCEMKQPSYHHRDVAFLHKSQLFEASGTLIRRRKHGYKVAVLEEARSNT